MDISEKEKFDTAFKLHREGKTAEAEKAYIEILNTKPDNYEVLNLLGLLYLSIKIHIFMKIWQGFIFRKKVLTKPARF